MSESSFFINPILNQDPIPVFESNTHIITSCTSHKDLWVWTSKSDPTSMFCITAALQWLREHFTERSVDDISPRKISLRKRTKKRKFGVN